MIEQEPIGWINKHNLESIAQEGAGNVWNEPYFNGDIQLYAHSMRELTDKEIDDLIHEYNCIDDYCHAFVRACIKKASEK